MKELVKRHPFNGKVLLQYNLALLNCDKVDDALVEKNFEKILLVEPES